MKIIQRFTTMTLIRRDTFLSIKTEILSTWIRIFTVDFSVILKEQNGKNRTVAKELDSIRIQFFFFFFNKKCLFRLKRDFYETRTYSDFSFEILNPPRFPYLIHLSVSSRFPGKFGKKRQE